MSRTAGSVNAPPSNLPPEWRALWEALAPVVAKYGQLESGKEYAVKHRAERAERDRARYERKAASGGPTHEGQ